MRNIYTSVESGKYIFCPKAHIGSGDLKHTTHTHTNVYTGMDWTAHNIEFFCTIQPEFQYEVPDDIEDYDAEL